MLTFSGRDMTVFLSLGLFCAAVVLPLFGVLLRTTIGTFGGVNDLELTIVNTAKQHNAQTLYRLQSVPGIGKILALVLWYEIHDIVRFPRVQDFVSYCRLVKCTKESAGKRYGTSGAKIGNAYLKWAFSEAAVLFLRNNPTGQKYVARLEKKHGKGKALTILAHKLARAVYYMLRRDTAFDLQKFLNG
jgi:transposase